MKIELTKKEFRELRILFDWLEIEKMPVESRIVYDDKEIEARDLHELRDKIFE